MGKKKRNSGLRILGFLALGFAVGIVFAFFYFQYSYIKPLPSEKIKRPEVKLIPQEKPALPPKPAERQEPAYKGPRVAIVIDDMGQDMKKLREIEDMNAPIAVAVLPNLRYSKQTADGAHHNGLEVLLHLPMEPQDLKDNNPGKGALFTTMTAGQIRTEIENDLKTVPNAIGVNNHMGSKFTENDARMRDVLEVVKKKDMFFLDSRTSSRSVAGRLAREIGMRNIDRNVFLDNTRDEKYIEGQITELVTIAKKRGKAIAIGHPYAETLEVLKKNLPGLNNAGVKVVKLSDLLDDGK